MTDCATLEYTDEQGLETSSVGLRRHLLHPCSDRCPSRVVSKSEYTGEGEVVGTAGLINRVDCRNPAVEAPREDALFEEEIEPAESLRNSKQP